MEKEKVASKGLQRLRAKFETSEILDALHCFDKIRPIISDHDFRPPKTRENLLKLHSMAMELVNYQSADEEEKLKKVLKLANDIHIKVYTCLKNLMKVKVTLEKLYGLGRKRTKKAADV